MNNLLKLSKCSGIDGPVEIRLYFSAPNCRIDVMCVWSWNTFESEESDGFKVDGQL